MKILVVCRNFKKGLGISEWILNYYQELAKKPDVSIDLLIEENDSDLKESDLPAKIKLLKIHSLKHSFIKYLFDWRRISQQSDSKYDYIHIHLDNFVRFFYLPFLSHKDNIILHSHNGYSRNVAHSFVKRNMHRFGKFIVKHGHFIHFACSDLAAKWLFEDSEYLQINNGVELLKFRYQNTLRQTLRSSLQLEHKKVYGHVGRFAYQKNQTRLIQIFAAIYHHDQNSRLVLVGKGPDESKLKTLVKQLRIEKVVLFLGQRSDVAQLLNAFDYIIFPSHYEGLPIALVEAQANGVPVFYSDTITKEIELLPTSFSFSLQDDDKKIAQHILQAESLSDRTMATSILKTEGYDRSDVVEQLYQFYKQH